MITPPKWINLLLRNLCKPELLEEIEGDLQEYYGIWVEEFGEQKARRLYIWHAFKFLRPFAIKKIRSSNSNQIIMLHHALLISFRNFRRHYNTFFINLIGLSSGLFCILMIYLWVNDELSFDKFHENDDQLYQVMQNKNSEAGIRTMEWTPGPLAEALVNEMPEVERAVTVMSSSWFPDFDISEKGENLAKAKGQFTGKDFFSLFSFELIHGDPEKLLNDKNEIIISESLALQLFNTTEDIVGKTLEWEVLEFKGLSRVSGVFKDVPVYSTQQFDFVLPMDLLMDFLPRFRSNWEASAPDTYILLEKGIELDRFNSKISSFIQSKDPNIDVSLFIRQYSDRYLYGNYKNGVQNGGRIEYVKLFSSIAIFILCIACINFTNLSTANASRRTKEIGLKKVVGAHRSVLILQYLVESIALALLSLFAAMLLLIYLLPEFNEIAGKEIMIHFDPKLVLMILGITLITGLLAGSYPAFYMTRFSPGKILEGKLKTTAFDFWARKGLVVFQFVTSLVLIIAVLVVYKQTTFIQTANLGFDKDNLIYIENKGNLSKNLDAFVSEAKNITGVENVSSTSHTMTGTYMTTDDLNWPEQTRVISFEIIEGNYDLIETLNITLNSGRSFSRDFGDESSKIIFNEKAIAEMGIEDPIGKKVNIYDKEYEIVGITDDFHLESFHESIKPTFFILKNDNPRIVMLKIRPENKYETLEHLGDLYKAHNPDFPFEYNFLDENYKSLYVSEQRVSILSKYFAGLAILISCLGLLGLSAFNAERRLKEIGIRKVLGSSVLGIIQLLSKEFTKIILIANVIAIPIGYFFLKKWLNDYAYRIEMEWWFFALSGIVTLLIAWIIVGWQTLKVARINPIRYLRNE